MDVAEPEKKEVAYDKIAVDVVLVKDKLPIGVVVVVVVKVKMDKVDNLLMMLPVVDMEVVLMHYYTLYVQQG